MVDFSRELKIINPENLEERMKSPRNHQRARNASRKSLSSRFHHQHDEGSKTTYSGRTSLSRTNREMRDHDNKAKLVVGRLKMAILLFFTLTAVGVMTAFFVYRDYHTRTRETAYKKRFREEAQSMLANIGANIDLTLGATDAFAISMLSEADVTNQTYPFVTIDNFAVQAGKLLKNSRAKYITTYNYVVKEQRKEWEAYTKSHNSWIDQSIDVQNRNPEYKGPKFSPEFLAENYTSPGNYDFIHGYDEFFYDGNSTDGLDHDGPYLPIWQCIPVLPLDPIYNWDVLDDNDYNVTILKAIETHTVTIGEPYLINWDHESEKTEYNALESEWFKPYLEPGEEAMAPVFDIYYPIIENAIDNVRLYENAGHKSSGYETTENDVGALLALSIYWRDMLRDLLPSGSAGVIVVFKNPASPPFAFEITEPTPKYLGVGYFNETCMGDQDLNITTGLLDVWDFAIANTSYTGVPVNEDNLPYTVEVYPAESARAVFMENDDNSVYVILGLVLAVSIMTIVFTFLFFFLYDRLVRNEIQSKINLLDAKRNFVRFVSHEVRTPLNTVCMGLTLIHQDFHKREKKMKEKQDVEQQPLTSEDFAHWSSLTQEVRNNADVAVGVLNDLLNIDKIQMGAFKLEMEALPIWQIVEQTTAEFSMMADKQKTSLRLDLSSLVRSEDDIESPVTDTSMLESAVLDKKLIGDEQRLRQVLRNLLSNAIKFSKNGSVSVNISTLDISTGNTSTRDMGRKASSKEFMMSDGTRKSFAASGRIVVDVVDTGVGMTPVQLQTVFDVGTQFNANKLQSGGGSGLGLAFAKAIAEQHGGSLRAYSGGKDKGTTFRLDLPLYRDKSGKDALDSTNQSEASEVSTSSTSSQKKKDEAKQQCDKLEPMNILVVDDAPMNRKLLVRLLESNGHTTSQAENGQDLIDTVRKNMAQYDCILVDYEMPVMNGPEACKGVREMGYTGFVVGVTGNLLPEDIGYFMDCGADAVLPKPFRYNHLEELLIEHGMFDLK